MSEQSPIDRRDIKKDKFDRAHPFDLIKVFKDRMSKFSKDVGSHEQQLTDKATEQQRLVAKTLDFLEEMEITGLEVLEQEGATCIINKEKTMAIARVENGESDLQMSCIVSIFLGEEPPSFDFYSFQQYFEPIFGQLPFPTIRSRTAANAANLEDMLYWSENAPLEGKFDTKRASPVLREINNTYAYYKENPGSMKVPPMPHLDNTILEKNLYYSLNSDRMVFGQNLDQKIEASVPGLGLGSVWKTKGMKGYLEALKENIQGKIPPEVQDYAGKILTRIEQLSTSE